MEPPTLDTLKAFAGPYPPVPDLDGAHEATMVVFRRGANGAFAPIRTVPMGIPTPNRATKIAREAVANAMIPRLPVGAVICGWRFQTEEQSCAIAIVAGAVARRRAQLLRLCPYTPDSGPASRLTTFEGEHCSPARLRELRNKAMDDDTERDTEVFALVLPDRAWAAHLDTVCGPLVAIVRSVGGCAPARREAICVCLGANVHAIFARASESFREMLAAKIAAYRIEAKLEGSALCTDGAHLHLLEPEGPWIEDWQAVRVDRVDTYPVPMQRLVWPPTPRKRQRSELEPQEPHKAPEEQEQQ